MDWRYFLGGIFPNELHCSQNASEPPVARVQRYLCVLHNSEYAYEPKLGPDHWSWVLFLYFWCKKSSPRSKLTAARNPWWLLWVMFLWNPLQWLFWPPNPAFPQNYNGHWCYIYVCPTEEPSRWEHIYAGWAACKRGGSHSSSRGGPPAPDQLYYLFIWTPRALKGT